MQNQRKTRWYGWCMAGLLLLTGASRGTEVAPAPQPENKGVLEEKLGGKDRILAYLSTDKPIYRAGETVYFRGVLLDAKTNIPASFENRPPQVSLVLKGPKGDIVARLTSTAVANTSGLSWTVPAGQAGGEYTATLTANGCAPAERKFDIRAYNPPRLKTQIEFVRKGYGPGDTVQGVVNVKRAEGGIPAGAKVTAIARVDGAEVARLENLAVDAQGNCAAEFKLPPAIEVGDGTLAFRIEDGGVIETASKTIPILAQNLDIAFYPEGGDLIEGLPCRVYVQARRPDGKPADVEGKVCPLGETGELLDVSKPMPRLKTSHEGRGVLFHRGGNPYPFFTPTPESTYALVLTKPSGIKKIFRLPAVKKTGATLRANKESYPYDSPISLTVFSTADSAAAKVTLCKRETEIVSATVEPGKETTLLLDAKDYEGVLIATVWDAQGKPLAERLVFRQPKFAVNIKITPEAKEFVPGGKVKLNIETTDAKGSPVETVVGLAVTDEAVLEMIDKREQAPRLPVMVYLENEVKDLADAQVYFDAKNPDAARDIDLLLGTQGWRRFILVKFDELVKTDPDAAKRALAFQQRNLIRPITGAVRAAADDDDDDDMPVPVMAPAMPAAAGAAQPEGAVDAAAQVLHNPQVLVANGRNQAIPAVPEEQRAVVLDELKKAEAPAAEDAKRNVADLEEKQDARAGEMKEEANAKINGDQIAIVAGVGRLFGRARPEPGQYVAIREYAHAVRKDRKPNDRVDFTETLYWNAGIRTGARDGKAQVEFSLSDSVTTFSVRADAFGNNGALGEATVGVESLEPFYIEPKLPVSVTAGDRIELPVAFVNSTDKTLKNANLLVKADGLDAAAPAPADLQPKERARRIVTLNAAKPGTYTITLSAAAGGYVDTVTRTLTVAPRGFPIEVAGGGLFSAEKKFVYKLTLPQTLVAGSLSAAAKVYPTPLANMQEALNALLRQPCGCFEQTSSTNYPLVMAQQYFTTHQGVDPATIKKAGDLLADGYKKLTGFECKDKGYEWFGGDPAHEALTAYGLMQFCEMSSLMPVDSGMIGRTRTWLLSRRDGKGGFLRNDRALDSFGRAPVPTTNAYIVWSLLESGEDPAKLAEEIAAVKKEGQEAKDPYVVALAANVLFLAKDNPAALELCKKLSAATGKDGSLTGATSITCSGGESLTIETTSLAILAWLRAQGEYAPQVEKSMQWLFESCKAGRFGTTQSTILALKAINAYDKARAKPKAAGSVQLRIDGNAFGKLVEFTPDTKGAISLPDFAAALTPGEHTLELVMTGGSEMPCGLEVKYYTPLPVSAAGCNLTLSTALSAETIAEGEPLEMKVKLTVGTQIASTPVAVIGIPAGLEPRHDQLKELVKAGRIDSYEVTGQEVVLYWRALKAGQVVELPLSLKAAIPGQYAAPASRAYLYYTDELKSWVPGLNITVNPQQLVLVE